MEVGKGFSGKFGGGRLSEEWGELLPFTIEFRDGENNPRWLGLLCDWNP
jgi:hypothetical protein